MKFLLTTYTEATTSSRLMMLERRVAFVVGVYHMSISHELPGLCEKKKKVVHELRRSGPRPVALLHDIHSLEGNS